ncbi:MAG: flagellar biosynthesis protein FlgD, partial [Gammaproteobacteria bacterium]|nr:flagellar biosynthesis protein FlgD [Gammaproteobacteria bacterium]
MSINSLSTSTVASTTATKARNGLQELGSDQFIALMVAQMRNQDPMKPTEPSEFLGQLAQFSTVSGVRAMQDSMTDMVTAMRSSQMLSGTSLVGRDVLAASRVINHDGVSAVSGAIEVPLGVSSATMMIKDSNGALVRRIPLSTQTGLNDFAWDG